MPSLALLCLSLVKGYQVYPILLNPLMSLILHTQPMYPRHPTICITFLRTLPSPSASPQNCGNQIMLWEGRWAPLRRLGQLSWTCLPHSRCVRYVFEAKYDSPAGSVRPHRFAWVHYLQVWNTAHVSPMMCSHSQCTSSICKFYLTQY